MGAGEKRLTVNLPVDVWERLESEARQAGKNIGPYVRGLIVKRDKRVSDRSDTDRR